MDCTHCTAEESTCVVYTYIRNETTLSGKEAVVIANLCNACVALLIDKEITLPLPEGALSLRDIFSGL